jgi:hypothetical protein
MPLRLVDPEHTKVIDVSGTKIHIRSLTAAEFMKLSLLWKPERTSNEQVGVQFAEKLSANYEDVAQILAKAIVKIEGFEDRPALSILMNLADVEDFMRILNAVMEFSTLSEDEGKNFDSSSVGSSASPARA